MTFTFRSSKSIRAVIGGGALAFLTVPSALSSQQTTKAEASATNAQAKTAPATSSDPAALQKLRMARRAREANRTVTAAYTNPELAGGATFLFFSDGTYVRSDADTTRGFETRSPIRPIFGDLGLRRIDAAMHLDGQRSYMFGSRQQPRLARYMRDAPGEYTRLTMGALDDSYPRRMPGGWQNMPAEWSTLDAAVGLPGGYRRIRSAVGYLAGMAQASGQACAG